MSYRIDVFFSPVNELITSLYFYACKKSHKRSDLGLSWIKSIQNTVDRDFLSQIDEDDIWIPFHLLARHYGKNDIKGFLDWIDNLTIGEIYELLSPLVHSFPKNLSEAKEKMVYLLKEWNNYYFNDFNQKILLKMEEEAIIQKGKISLYTDPIKFGDYITNGVVIRPLEGLEEVLFIPQYHLQPGILFHSYGGVTICTYSPYIFLVEEGEPSPKLQHMTKALSDKSRLKILSFLAKNPASFIEVHKFMGLAKSTVHDHLIILRTAGLINVEILGENTGIYEFRKESFGNLLNLLENFVFKE